MRLVTGVTVQLLLLIFFITSWLKAQQEPVISSNSPVLVQDTLNVTDWNAFDTYLLNQHADSAYSLIAKRLLAGKHKLSDAELIQKLPALIQVFQQAGRIYQLQNIVNTINKTADSLHDMNVSSRLYAALAAYYETIRDWKSTYVAYHKYDSLHQIILNNERDSIYTAAQQNFDTALRDIRELNNKLEASEQRESDKSLYITLLAAAVLVLLLVTVILLILHFKRKPTKQTESVTPIQKEEKQDLTPLAQHIQTAEMITALMLQKGRTGEDLAYLKVLEHSVEQLHKSYFTFYEVPIAEPDNIIRRLKHIRIMLIGSNASELMLMKDMLKRSIRLTEIFTSELLNADTLSQPVDAYIILEPHPSLIDKHQLPEPVKSKLISIGFTQEHTLTKPFPPAQLIQELMKLYSYREPETTTPSTGFIQTQTEQSVSSSLIESLQDVNVRSNRQEFFALLNSAKSSQPDNEALHHQIEKLIQHYDALNALQIELAIRNIISYLTRKSS